MLPQDVSSYLLSYKVEFEMDLPCAMRQVTMMMMEIIPLVYQCGIRDIYQWYHDLTHVVICALGDATFHMPEYAENSKRYNMIAFLWLTTAFYALQKLLYH